VQPQLKANINQRGNSPAGG